MYEYSWNWKKAKLCVLIRSACSDCCESQKLKFRSGRLLFPWKIKNRCIIIYAIAMTEQSDYMIIPIFRHYNYYIICFLRCHSWTETASIQANHMPVGSWTPARWWSQGRERLDSSASRWSQALVACIKETIELKRHIGQLQAEKGHMMAEREEVNDQLEEVVTHLVAKRDHVHHLEQQLEDECWGWQVGINVENF